LDNVNCTGTETDIADCRHNEWGVEDCQGRETASVSCNTGILLPNNFIVETLHIVLKAPVIS